MRVHLGLVVLGAVSGVGSAALAADPLPYEASAAALIAAYPDFLSSRDGNDLVWTDGTKMPIDDGKGEKPFETMLNGPDIKDQFAQPYAPGKPAAAPDVNQDPGRIRYDALFRKMYGDCRKGGVGKDMEAVAWLPKHRGGKVMFSIINGAAKALQDVSDELDALPEPLIKFLKPTAGTFNCRVIAGTDRASMHSYGVAIDINTAHAHYWRNAKADGKGRLAYQNDIPIEVVEIFERHGFIWGGKWYHYDTMHFEYRPELLPATAAP